MTVISSETNLVDMPAGWWPLSTGVSLSLYNNYTYDYATIYKTQPNVRVCVDFLARNLAQLGLHVYRRKADNDRERLRDHALARILKQPLPAQYKVTGYRLIDTLMGDLGVYFNAYWLKLKSGGKLYGLLRIPPELVTVIGTMNPAGYKIYLGTDDKEFEPEEIVHFRGYNATNAVLGLSPLETLRRILAEEHASGDYREHFWQNAARMNGVIERPEKAADWSDTARARFKSEFEALYSGSANSGKTAILEEGMTWKQISFNPQEAEYLSGRKLTREECARAYHIPLPLVGILDHASFCLPARAPIYTENGPKPIVDVTVGEKVWSHDGYGFVLKPVISTKLSGVDPILKIKTQNRTIEANAKHPILVRKLVKVAGKADPNAPAKVRAGQSRWHYEVKHVFVPAGELNPGDIIVAISRLPDGGIRKFTIPKVEFFGLFLGDGWFDRKRGNVSIARGENADYMDYYRDVMIKEFVNFGNNGNGRSREIETQPVNIREDGERATRFTSIVAVEELEKLGFSGDAHTKRIPGWVFKATREERLALLRGLFEADGSVDKRGKISYTSCNRDLTEDVRHLCFSLGIPVNNIYHGHGISKLPNGTRKAFDAYTITLSDPEKNREIGSHSPRDLKRLENGKGWSRKGKLYPYAHGVISEPPFACEYSKVVSIDLLPEEPVYDLEVADSHTFIASGIVVHNSNITEQHKMLYTDVMGPWASMIEQEIDLQVKPDLDTSGDVYVEFNISEKLQGDFETQSKSLQSAIGRPWMTANEGRGIMNLPRIDGGDELITPLNVSIGGQASPNDVDPTKQAGDKETKAKIDHFDMNNPQMRAEYEEKWRRLLVRIFKRQEAAILPAVKKSMDKKDMLDINLLWDTERWNTEVGKDFYQLSWDTGMAWARWMADALAIGLNELVMKSYIEESARIAAEQMNLSTRIQIESAILDAEPRSALENVFFLALSSRVFYMATSRTTAMSNYGAFSAAYQGKVNTKTWKVNSDNPRHSHSVINGETVPIRSVFSNNLRWPGDYRGGAEENANCQCSVIYNRNR